MPARGVMTTGAGTVRRGGADGGALVTLEGSAEEDSVQPVAARRAKSAAAPDARVSVRIVDLVLIVFASPVASEGDSTRRLAARTGQGVPADIWSRVEAEFSAVVERRPIL